MAMFCLPLSTAQVAAYHNVESLVDVAVQNKDGTTDIITFDSMLLPWHSRDDFLEQLFLWANNEDVLPLSSYGTWNGKDPGSEIRYVHLQISYRGIVPLTFWMLY